MKIIILGTGTSIPSLNRGSSAYLIITEGQKILVDIGPSVVRRLLEYGYSVNDIDVIVLTHFHVDHTADLSTFLFACNYGIKPRTEPLRVFGGPGIHKFYKGLLNVYPWISPKSYKMMLKSIYRGQEEVNDVLIRAAKVNHNKESIGISFEKVKRVVFSGDTDYSKNLMKLAYRADLLITECSFPERKVKGHINLSVLEKMVKQAQPEKVILSHLYPEWDTFKGILHKPYLIAEDGLEITL
ncbi:MAG: ribonuclease Z [Proteobacteria bacterium]|nr:ribonuclease Z [Pseudomonadota bacterium]